jgi:hypothetical protein
VSKEAAEYLDKKHCEVIAQPTPKAVDSFNKSEKDRIGLFHVTC